MRYLSIIMYLMVLAPFASALEEAQGKSWLNSVYQLRVNSYYSINSFYNYSVKLGDKEHYLTMRESTDQMDQLNDSLLSSGVDGALDGQYSEVANLVSQYLDLLEENVEILENEGYSNLAMAGDLAVVHIDLNQKLSEVYGELKSVTPYKLPKFVELSHQSSLTMALMMTKYSARSTSGTSQVYVGSDKEETLDVLAGVFDKQLNNLIGQSSEPNELLRAAETKWEFIENSYVNYNQARVNFIVNLYSKKIIRNLENAGQGA